MGIPAKSAGSLIEPITTSNGQSRSSAKARTTDVFPVPGLPQRTTGTPALIARARASVTIAVSMTDLLAARISRLHSLWSGTNEE
jgi:hypothetical protein